MYEYRMYSTTHCVAYLLCGILHAVHKCVGVNVCVCVCVCV